MNDEPEKTRILEEFRRTANELGHPPSRSEFQSLTGLSEYRILRHFPSYREAVRAAGLEPDATNIKLEDECLLQDWARVVRARRQVPTRQLYRREGQYSLSVFDKHFGPWSALPGRFRDWASNKVEWADVVALLPTNRPTESANRPVPIARTTVATSNQPAYSKHTKLDGRPTYGNPIDFRGLRHEPVNEQGVVFLFGMVARELGYLVEQVQIGFPDCEAKRQIGPNKWQKIRIEFEFESREYRNHGHPSDGCDVIVCWRHNWADCPTNIEVVELSRVIQTLSKSED